MWHKLKRLFFSDKPKETVSPHNYIHIGYTYSGAGALQQYTPSPEQLAKQRYQQMHASQSAGMFALQAQMHEQATIEQSKIKVPLLTFPEDPFEVKEEPKNEIEPVPAELEEVTLEDGTTVLRLKKNVSL